MGKVIRDDLNPSTRTEDTGGRANGADHQGPRQECWIGFPDLPAASEFEVVADRCRMMGSFIVAAAFDELKAFHAADRLVDMFRRGDIPLANGAAGTQLYNYWREAPNRMSEVQRGNFYAMALGLPTGQPGVAVNSDFQQLWLRFLSSVSSLVRESRADRLGSKVRTDVAQQHVREAARDLAANMSAHAYGSVCRAAGNLQKQVADMTALLSEQELQGAFGTRDMWGVIDDIAESQLGGARNSSRYRMLAISGAIITNWIANNMDRLRDPAVPMIDLCEAGRRPVRSPGETDVSNPTDDDLVNSSEMWLADSGLGEAEVKSWDR